MRLEDLQTPALIVRLDRVASNVARMLALVPRPDAWRPHVKTAKIPEVLDSLLASGVRRFKCATTREAEVLLSRAQRPVDLVVAMAYRGANLNRAAELAVEYPQHRLSMLTEDPDHAREVRTADPGFGLFIDLNPGFDRTGIPRADRARVQATAEAAGDALRGLHDYEGQVRSPDIAERRCACGSIYTELIDIASSLVSSGHRVEELVTSGTPTFVQALEFEPFRAFDHQVSPGTVVYWDGLSEAFGLTGFVPAATVLTRVISNPAAGRATCDAGGKAVDAAAGDPCATIPGRPALRAGRPSEEHLPLVATDGDAPRAGELLELVPAHVCPTVNLADEVALVEGAIVTAIVPVEARGHEVAPRGRGEAL